MITLLAAAAVTLQSLLAEMTDYNAVAHWPDPSYTCHQASSYDRGTKTPDDPKGWFANGDQNQYIRIETNQNCIEKVMMDTAGPGAIVRFWITTHAAKKGNIRIYLDGAKQPTITVPSFDFANNNALPAGNPLLTLHPGATPEARGGNTLYLPIPYAKHCKVTWEELEPGPKFPSRYYQINYRTYPPGTKVETFKPGNYDRVNQCLANPPAFDDPGLMSPGSIAPGAEATLDFGGPAAVRVLEVRADPAHLRTLVLRAEFDGEQTIWCPIGDFFGSGVGLNALDSWYRTVKKDGTMSCRWVMPYRKSAKFALLNLGKTPVKATLSARVDQQWQWDDRSLYFHASWRQQDPIPTRPMIDWNYLAATGQGIFVGDSLVVFNPVRKWWGEGDEKIYVDGESFPSHIGTGTEDYYNYSWCHTGLFQTPFANQIRCDGPGNAGYTVVNRTRSLDGIPFTKSFRFDMEVWHWGECDVGYAATTYWYARPGATCNRPPQPDEAVRPLHEPPAPFRIAGALECETMQIVAQTPGIPVGPQPLHGDWSSDAQLWIRGKQTGDFIELRIPATQKRKLTLYSTKSWDYGILRFSVNGRPAGKDFDAWAEKPIPSGAIPLGVFEPKNGAFILRVEVVGANPKSKNSKSFFGLDAVALTEP
ncbi:MAG: DUF2961 domain-containing protein [Verrucomicrobia bacterium]|nr:DUF2961 domain-containing protein [Verrucomicrobiota bacterium]